LLGRDFERDLAFTAPTSTQRIDRNSVMPDRRSKSRMLLVFKTDDQEAPAES